MPALAGDRPAETTGRKEFLLKHRLSVNVTEEVGYSGQSLRIIPRPRALKDEPKYRSPKPLYSAVFLGARREVFHLVLDSSSGENRGYDILYVDADQSGRISAAKKFTTIVANQGAVFGPVKLLIDSGQERCPQWFLFRLIEYADKASQVERNFLAINAGYYEGVVTFGDRKHRIAVVDADGNGLYNDLMKDESHAGDRLLIDCGKVEGSAAEKGQPLGRYLLVDDRYWQMDVAADGSSVIVEALEKRLGGIRTGLADFTLLLNGEEGGLQVHSTEGVVRVPAGKYHLFRVQYRLADPSGRRWHFLGQARAGTMVEVPAKGEVKVPLGPPLVPKVALTSPEAGRLVLDVSVSGNGGETYRAVHFGAGETPPVPKARILDAGGRELAVLDFHYG
jgi:hypothetical protein